MGFKDYSYPMNVAIAVFHTVGNIPKGWTEQSIEKAIHYVVLQNKPKRIREFVVYRYKANRSYESIAAVMKYNGPDYPRQIDEQFISQMKSAKVRYIISHGQYDSNGFAEMFGSKWEIPVTEMGLDMRSYHVIGRNLPGWIEDAKAKDVIALFRDETILNIKGFGRKHVYEKLIPKLEDLGFTEDEIWGGDE